MKRRRGRRGLVWWSWLLVLVTVGGVVGGYKMGEKEWEKAPKDYLAVAKTTFNVRKPFVARNAAVALPSEDVVNPNEEEVMRMLESNEVLSRIVTDLELTDAWAMGTEAAVLKVRDAVDLRLEKETGELFVEVILNDPEDAAEVANAVAKLVPETIKAFDNEKKAAANKLLEVESRPLEDAELEARTKLEHALAGRGIRIKVTPEVDLTLYQEFKDVLTAKVEWDSAREDLGELKKEQSEYRLFWMRSLRPSIVAARAEPSPANGFVGPEIRPYQMRWATYGLTAGMFVGSLLMLICWKLFP